MYTFTILEPVYLLSFYSIQTVGMYDQEMPQSETTDQCTAPRGRDIEQKQQHNRKNTNKPKQLCPFV